MKIVVLWEEGFPFVDTIAWTQEAIRTALEQPSPPQKRRKARFSSPWDEREFRFVGKDTLASELTDVMETVLLTPYGSAFPKAAWPVIYDFLNRGGSWVNVGGSPLSRPVRKNRDGSWYVEVSTTSYSKELFINQAFPIELNGEEDLQWTGEVLNSPILAAPITTPPLLCSRAWSLQVRFTATKDFPHEGGSGGNRDAVLRTLAFAKRDGRRIAAPIIVIDRLRGPFMGGRWVLVNAELEVALAPSLLQTLLHNALQGPMEFEMRPSFACYYKGEQPMLIVRAKSFRLRGSLDLAIMALAGGEASTEAVATIRLTLTLSDTPVYHYLPLKIRSIGPGLYRVICLAMDGLGVAADQQSLVDVMTGFWIYDEKPLTSGKPLTLNRDYFERDGEPYPVMGTTYMAGDTHRKFLFEPNPVIWDEDFAAMKAAGVNLVRTGLWTAWKRAMLDPGAMDEGVLRAFTAFLLTARKYDIPIIFNFFAFWPEEWGGSNPYLDPRAVEAQKEFVAAFAHRFARVNDLIWDFINEPSFSSPVRVWSTRPNYDKFEQAAWAKWLEERSVEFSPEEAQATDPADVWRERWRLTSNAPLDLPALADFQDQYIFQGTHPLRVLDYRLFAQEMFNRWVAQLAAVVRSNGNPHQLITVGQDEGGTGERPNPHFFADVVDFTTNHSWWQNDDLLWDSVMTKTPNKPNLIQETGIMFVENVDGGYRRTPEECANLLARKLALAFAGGCAGAIQWLWNTNIYMDSDNEVGIGFIRADGTEKPELEVFRGMAKFFWENRHRMVGRKLEETVVVIPHANMFSVRNLADGTTRRAVRTLEYDLRVPTRTVSEYRIQDIGEPKFIVLPSPRVLTQSCWETLLSKVEAGATLLVTGPIDWDEYYRAVPRLNRLDSGLETETCPVTRFDFYIGRPFPWYRLDYGGDKIQKLDKVLLSGPRIEASWACEPHPEWPGTYSPSSLEDQMKWKLFPIAHGKGQVLYFRFPIELTDNGGEANLFLYREALIRAGILPEGEAQTKPGGGRFLVRPVQFAMETLYLTMGEAGDYGYIQINFADYYLYIGGGTHIPALAFLDNESGEITASNGAGISVIRNKTTEEPKP